MKKNESIYNADAIIKDKNLILATKGKGMSFGAKFDLINSLSYEDNIIVVDPESDYSSTI